MIQKILFLLNAKERNYLIMVSLFLLVGVFFEMLSFAIIVPIFNVIFLNNLSEDFFSKIFLLSTKKNKQTYSIKTIDIINEFLSTSDENILEEINYICSIILKHEFKIKIKLFIIY
jgi:hypothetical protein